MRTWPEVEAALQGRPGWRRVGREHHGPCPVSGAGTDTAWFAAGSGSGGVRCGCRHCGGAGGRLDGEALREHLAAVCGEDLGAFPGRPEGANASVRGVASGSASMRPAGRGPNPTTGPGLADALWRAGGTVDGTAGRSYLHGRGCWPGGGVAALRWLTTAAAARIGLRPTLPDGAAGCLCYRFGAPGEVGTLAVQVEAVDGEGRRVLFGNGTKRLSVSGSDFGGGARVFLVGGDVARGVHLCEGPLDALALAALERLGAVELHGAAVAAAAGTGGFRPAACIGSGPAWLWAQDDRAGILAAVRLGTALRVGGRAVSVKRPAEGLTGRDWADVAAEAAAEREAMRDD